MNSSIFRLNSNKKMVIKLIAIGVLIFFFQMVATKICTKKGVFSKRAFIRNYIFIASIFFFIEFRNIGFLMIPFLFEILVEMFKLKGFHLEPWIATQNVYDDYFSPLTKINPQLSNFSEGLYDKMFGLDTLDFSSSNIRNLLDWSVGLYQNAIDVPKTTFLDIQGKEWTGKEVKKIGEKKKFELICKVCKVTSSSKILEIGFGELDFMEYLRENYKIEPVGVSISKEQVKKANNKGFTAHCMNFWDINPEILGTFDIIMQLGNIEYIKLAGQKDEDVYRNYGKKILPLLEPNGKYFITGIHLNEHFRKYKTIDYYNAYLLWSGNDGYYPKSKNSFSDAIEKEGFCVLWREDRTLDYYLTSIFWFSVLYCGYSELCRESYYEKDLLKAIGKTFCDPYFIHSFLTYTPTSNIYLQPWIWQFIPQEQTDGSFISPVTLEYILFQKTNL